MKFLFTTVKYLLITAVCAMTLLLIGTLVPIAGGIKVKIVKSGSMEPAIKTGGVVIIKPESDYQVGDVVTFGPDTKERIPTTHRIIAVVGSGAARVFQTKGDANDAPDQANTRINDISGKVIFTVPYAGYVLDFARKPVGFALLVGVPALAIIFDELTKIFEEMRKLRRRKVRSALREEAEASTAPLTPNQPPIVSAPPVRTVASDGIRRGPVLRTTESFDSVIRQSRSDTVISRIGNTGPGIKMMSVLFLAFGTFFGLSSVGGTLSYFNDSEFSLDNLLRAGVVSLTLAPVNEPTGFRMQSISSQESSEDAGEEKPSVGDSPNIGSALIALEVGKGDASLPIIYTIDAVFDENAPEGCKVMTIEAWIDELHVEGLLTDFHTPGVTTLGRTQFLLTLPVPNTLPPHAECKGALRFHAKIAGLPSPLSDAFSDTKSYPFSVLNEEYVTPSLFVAPPEEVTEEDFPPETLPPLETEENTEGQEPPVDTSPLPPKEEAPAPEEEVPTPAPSPIVEEEVIPPSSEAEVGGNPVEVP